MAIFVCQRRVPAAEGGSSPRRGGVIGRSRCQQAVQEAIFPRKLCLYECREVEGSELTIRAQLYRSSINFEDPTQRFPRRMMLHTGGKVRAQGLNGPSHTDLNGASYAFTHFF